MNEQDIANGIMKTFINIDKLEKAIDQFSCFDYESNHYLFEFKSRHTLYNPWIIERYKLDCNCDIADNSNKDFIYVTECLNTGYIWNISKLKRNNYDFKFEVRSAPESTELPNKNNRNMIDKEVGYLYVEDAVIIKL